MAWWQKLLWLLPLMAVTAWWSMLIVLYAYWRDEGRPVYAHVKYYFSIIYISDIGAQPKMHTVFIVLASTQGAFCALSLLADIYLRNANLLLPLKRLWTKIFAGFATFAGTGGQAAIILVAYYDTALFRKVHKDSLLAFIAAIGVSGLFIICEFWSLSLQYQACRLRWSLFWKVLWFSGSIALVVAFQTFHSKFENLKEAYELNTSALGKQQFTSAREHSAWCEWALAVLYGALFLIIAYDLCICGQPNPNNQPNPDDVENQNEK